MSRVPKIRIIFFLEYFIRKKVLQLIFCSIVIQNIQMFYGGPVMFVVACFLMYISECV